MGGNLVRFVTDKQIREQLNRSIGLPFGEVKVDDPVVIEVECHGRRNGCVDVCDHDLRVGGRAGKNAHASGAGRRSVHPEFSFEFWIDRGLTASLDARRGKLHLITFRGGGRSSGTSVSHTWLVCVNEERGLRDEVLWWIGVMWPRALLFGPPGFHRDDTQNPRSARISPFPS